MNERRAHVASGDQPGVDSGSTYEPTGVYGCYVVHIQASASDDRGELLRPFAAINTSGMSHEIDDIVIRSYRGVFRGMHIQHKSAPQWKYVRATRGIVSGAVVDTRKVRNGELFAQVALSADAPRVGPRQHVGLLIPPWCAWGYWSGLETCETTYRIWGRRVVEAERAIHYQGFGLAWTPPVDGSMSERDRNALPLSEVDTGW